MYIIFIDETRICLTDNLEYSAKPNFYFKDNITVEALLKVVKKGLSDSFYLYHSDIKELWREFKKFFKIEKAAGGIVENEEKDILFIYRFKNGIYRKVK